MTKPEGSCIVLAYQLEFVSRKFNETKKFKISQKLVIRVWDDFEDIILGLAMPNQYCKVVMKEIEAGLSWFQGDICGCIIYSTTALYDFQ